MKVFVTGGSGFLGTPIVETLLSQGHELAVLVRSDASAAKLPNGVRAVAGTTEQHDLLAAEAAKADAVIHLAFNHQLLASGKYAEALELDLEVIQALIGAMLPGKTFIGTSVSTVVGPTHGTAADETYRLSDDPSAARWKNEIPVTQSAERGVRGVVVRLPPFVYDKDGAAFSGILEGPYKHQGFASYKEDGSYQLAVVHVEDAAQLYVLALQHATAGAVYNCTHGHVSGKQVADAISHKLSLPTKSVTAEETASALGPLLNFAAAANIAISSEKARSQLHWRPVHASDEMLSAIRG